MAAIFFGVFDRCGSKTDDFFEMLLRNGATIGSMGVAQEAIEKEDKPNKKSSEEEDFLRFRLKLWLSSY